MEIVVEPRYVEKEEGPCIVSGVCGLDTVDKDCDHIGGGMVGSGTKLYHG